MNAETRLTITAAGATMLAAVSLYPLFTNLQWFWVSLAAVLVVAGSSEIARRLSTPLALTPVVALAALLCFLTAVFARTDAFLGFVPGPEALGELVEITRRGFSDIQHYAAPVPSFTSITLVTAAGVGITATLVDLLAVRARRAAVAGLPLLAIFSVTSAIQGGAGWLPFVCAAAGFCALLMTDARERVSRWGRRVAIRGRGTVGAAQTRPVSTDSLAASGRRIGFAAVAVAVLLPAIVPELPGRAAVSGWLAGLGGGGGAGPSAIRAPSPMVSLKRELTLPEDRVVLTYKTKDSSPAYLRLYALSKFNGRTWSMVPVEGRRVRKLPDDTMAPPPGTKKVRAKKITTRVTISRDVAGLRFLPLPYPSRQVDIAGQWRYDLRTLMVFSNSDVAGGRSYDVTSWDLRPTRERLRNIPAPPPAITERYTALPDDLPQLVRERARQVTKNADTAYEKAMALQEWFTKPGRFTYSLNVQPGGGSSALVNFLKQKIGYCEQFASAMAVMARVLGIPARVAVGYTAGSETTENTWKVSTHDAHAWPELYFHGIGWLRFEPTPAATGQPTATVPSYAQPAPDTSVDVEEGASDAEQEASSEANATVGPGTPRQMRPGFDAANTGGATYEAQSAPLVPTSAVLAVLALLLLACVPMTTRRLIRWRRWAHASGSGTATTRARAAWAELRDDARDLGLPWEASDSPRATARRLTSSRALSDEGVAALTRITTAEERARYARTPADFSELRDDNRTVRRALGASVGRPRRWTATALPRSALQVPQRVGVWVADGLNRVDAAGARLRARIGRKSRTAD